jgi:hypothetical protein
MTVARRINCSRSPWLPRLFRHTPLFKCRTGMLVCWIDDWMAHVRPRSVRWTCRRCAETCRWVYCGAWLRRQALAYPYEPSFCITTCDPPSLQHPNHDNRHTDIARLSPTHSSHEESYTIWGPTGRGRKMLANAVLLTDKWGNMTAALNFPRTKLSSYADITDVSR